MNTTASATLAADTSNQPPSRKTETVTELGAVAARLRRLRKPVGWVEHVERGIALERVAFLHERGVDRIQQIVSLARVRRDVGHQVCRGHLELVEVEGLAGRGIAQALAARRERLAQIEREEGAAPTAKDPNPRALRGSARDASLD